MSLKVCNVFIVKTSVGDSWILPLTKDLKRMVGQRQFSALWSGEWMAEVAHSLGRHLLMRHLLGHDFLPSETAFSRLRPWLRSAPAAGPWVDPFHIFPCDSYHGQWCNYTVSTKSRSKCRSNSLSDCDLVFWAFVEMDLKKDYLKKKKQLFVA